MAVTINTLTGDANVIKSIFTLAQELGTAQVHTATTNIPVQGGAGATGFVAFPTGTPRTVTPDFTNRLWDLYHLCIQAGVDVTSIS